MILNSKELKSAFLSGGRIEYEGTVYEEITAIIYRRKKGRIYETAELLDKRGNSVITVLGEKVREVQHD